MGFYQYIKPPFVTWYHNSRFLESRSPPKSPLAAPGSVDLLPGAASPSTPNPFFPPSRQVVAAAAASISRPPSSIYSREGSSSPCPSWIRRRRPLRHPLQIVRRRCPPIRRGAARRDHQLVAAHPHLRPSRIRPSTPLPPAVFVLAVGARRCRRPLGPSRIRLLEAAACPRCLRPARAVRASVAPPSAVGRPPVVTPSSSAVAARLPVDPSVPLLCIVHPPACELRPSCWPSLQP